MTMRRSALAAVAMVVLAVVLQGTHAAHPIDVSNQEAGSLKPMSLTEEQVASDPSRELLSSHYPPPPPVEAVQGERGWPTLSHSVGLDFSSADNATQFVNDVGGVVRLSRDALENAIQGRKLQQDLTSSAYVFANTYLGVALGASQAEDGKTEVTANGNSVSMETTLYYTEGTSEEEILADGTAFRTTVDNNRDGVLSQAQYDSLAGDYGITTERSTFLDAVTNEENFTTGDGDGAAALKSSLLMGAAAVLAACLLA